MNGEGGFDPQDTAGSTNETKYVVRTDDSMLPVTIKQIKNLVHDPNLGSLIDGRLAKQVFLIGRITKVVADELYFVYTITDGTGEFNVQEFVNESSQNPYSKDNYIMVYGRIAGDHSSIYSFAIRPLSNVNEISYHLTQALYAHLTHTKKLSAPVQPANTNKAPNQGIPKQTNSEPVQDPTERAKAAVLDYIKNNGDPTQGVSSAAIIAALGSKFSAEIINSTILSLSFNGEIYSTSEEDHYAIC